jgi:purine nucleosidase
VTDRKKIILDVDTGVDDALAILLAAKSPDLDLLAVTAVAGNVELEKTQENSLKVIEVAGRDDVPVAAGCDRPLIRPLRTAAYAHGSNGLNDVDFPKAKGELADKHSVDMIIDLIRRYPGEVTLIPTGPLTNIAMAIQKAPDIVGLMKEIVLMGGAAFCPGNTTAVAEFNIWVDPEAARVVFNSGAKVTMVGLDVTMRACLTQADVERMLAANRNRVTEFINTVLAPGFKRAQERHWDKGLAMHDPLTVAAVIDPTLIKTGYYHVDVATSGITDGMTVVDARSFHFEDQPGPNAFVATEVDAKRFIDLYIKVVTR